MDFRRRYIVGFAVMACFLAVAPAQAAAPTPAFLLPGEAVLTQRAADVTGDKTADQIYLVGKRDGKNEFVRNVNAVVEDGATREISRSLFSKTSGYRGGLEIGDFNGDGIDDVMFTLQRGDLTVKTYIVTFNQAVPQVVFQPEGDSEEIDVQSGDITITKADDGKTIHVKRGSTLQLQLPENPSTGYTWQFTRSSGGDALEFLSQQNFIPGNEPQMVGKPGLKVFLFKTKQPGTVEMTLANYRIWEGQESSMDHFDVTVDIVE